MAPSSPPNTQPNSQTTTPRPRSSRKRPHSARCARRNVAKLVRSSNSPLAKADLRSILANPLAWTILDPQSRDEILALFPDENTSSEPGTANARPNFPTLMSDDSFRYHCAAYTSNLSLGRHDHGWLTEAWIAHERRKAGDFDDYLRNKFVDEWLLDGTATVATS
ncbi:hypothetical protein GQ602_005345 [Ophiocordyceps camponoti-floridani]|uniref:ASX DEUBAD domain-containing protein n=1 Tax=Ophiocordyceps camponoti-floridani TaxID=2030778 RepID=A0A8H4Q5H6_9HYPO|nr:hypothetical protein GQ602_005345 [Ophiocordyceps camponoti-floridani]